MRYPVAHAVIDKARGLLYYYTACIPAQKARHFLKNVPHGAEYTNRNIKAGDIMNTSTDKNNIAANAENSTTADINNTAVSSSAAETAEVQLVTEESAKALTEDALIRLINHYARLKKSAALTQEQLGQQALLRKEYLNRMRAQIRAALDNTKIKEPDGTVHPLPKKSDSQPEKPVC